MAAPTGNADKLAQHPARRGAVPPPVQPLVIRLSGLRISRYDPKRKHTFEISVPELSVAAGAHLCLAGRSGSGKTTLLELLGLLSTPDSIDRFDLSPDGDGRMMSLLNPVRRGDVGLLGEIRARTMGFVLQDGGLLPYLTIRQNALLAAELSSGPGVRAVSDGTVEMARAVGMSQFLDRYPSELSGGQRQRGAVLRAVASAPKFIIADEPTAALDRQTSEDVLDLLVSSAARVGATIIAASHNPDLMAHFGFGIREVALNEGSDRTTATVGHNNNAAPADADPVPCG